LIILNSKKALCDYRNSLEKKGARVGFVPTMGFLHEGHLSLVRIAKENADAAIVSIFVNPTQFAPNEDLEKYPRDIHRDITLLEEVYCNALYMPSHEDIYPAGFQTYVDVNEISKYFEGESRPTHFRGVSTVVSILFNQIRPHFSVFGQKDAQQARLIQQMVKDLSMNIDVIVAPIVREKNGLAMSSRNKYLTIKEREDASIIYRTLLEGAELIKHGWDNAPEICQILINHMKGAEGAKPEYIKIVDQVNFSETGKLQKGSNYIILAACRFGFTRLIDNLIVEN